MVTFSARDLFSEVRKRPISSMDSSVLIKVKMDKGPKLNNHFAVIAKFLSFSLKNYMVNAK